MDELAHFLKQNISLIRTSLYRVLDRANTYVWQITAQSRFCYYKQEVVPRALYDDPLPAKVEADSSVELLV